jgi:pimeloyl-ACP methyl ester carboxylesterase
MKRVPLGDIELNVVERGGGLPLLLVHGFPLDHSMWQGQIDALAEHCRVIAPDLRGFGRSQLGSAKVLTMEQLADDLAGLLEALHVHERVIFCGLSMGGYVGWQFWRKHRQRLLALVACDTRAAGDTGVAATARRELAARVLNEGSVAAAEAMLPKLFSPVTVQQRPDLVEQMRQVMLATPPETIAAALEGLAVRPDVTELLPGIDVPTLVVVGQDDVIATVDEMQAIADAIPDAAWLVVPQAGHMSPLENPDVFNEALAEFVTL